MGRGGGGGGGAVVRFLFQIILFILEKYRISNLMLVFMRLQFESGAV